jgi:acyl-coenzyme A thioesterase PaaI-like protein
MEIAYLARAETDVTATATLEQRRWGKAEDIRVDVRVEDSDGREVVRATITMYVSPGRRQA